MTMTVDSGTAENSQESGLGEAQCVTQSLRQRLGAAVLGRQDVIDLVLIALLADGHVLLEDFPGSGKTTLARALGDALDVNDVVDDISAFRRIQFTPDLLPSDITGTNIFDVETSRFAFRSGPIFAHIVLADEINRTSPKVQAAMLEAMAEKQVTVDNHSYELDTLFFVMATQNPLDLAGTYRLPTPQLDRFLFKIQMKHIKRDAEIEVLNTYPRPTLEVAQDFPGVTRKQLLVARDSVRRGVFIAPAVKAELVDLARRLRDDRDVVQGASTRSLVLMLPALQARASMHGRDYVGPEDIEALAPHVFRHRLECAPGVADVQTVIDRSLARTMESLARQSLQR